MDHNRRRKGLREATNAPCFVKKLFEMMTFNPKILVWVSSEAFEIVDPVRLENEVLPFFFRHCRFQSLVRQLNFYAFKKISKERNSWVYSHECFQRDRPELLDFLRRKTNNLHQRRLRDESTAVPETSRHAASLKDASVCSSVDADSGTEEKSTDHTTLQDELQDYELEEEDFTDPEYDLEVQYLHDCEKDISLSALVADFLPSSLQQFCLRRNPWKRPQTLSSEVRAQLSLHPDLEAEFYDYVKALESPQYISSVRYNEVILLRYFMMFAVTRLQMALFCLEEHRNGSQDADSSIAALAICLDAWLSYTRSCV